MEILKFNSYCPFEIGDKVEVGGETGKIRTAAITDIICIHSAKTGMCDFLLELDNSRKFIKPVPDTDLAEEKTAAPKHKPQRFTQRTPEGASLILDNPRNDFEAAEQIQKKFKEALNLLADFEDLEFAPEEIATDVKEICDILHQYPVCTNDFRAIAEFCGKTALHNEHLRNFLKNTIVIARLRYETDSDKPNNINP